MRRTFTITHEGWFLFCPCWLPEGCLTSEIMEPIPKWNAWWLLNWAFAVSQAFNWIQSFIDEDLCGFAVAARPVAEPFQLTVTVPEELL